MVISVYTIKKCHLHLLGGEEGKDTCLGEGGAPLVCLDVERDQYYAVGM